MKRKAICEKDSFGTVKMAECASLLGRLQVAQSKVNAEFVSNSAFKFYSGDVVGVWAIPNQDSTTAGDCGNGSWILHVIRKLHDIYTAYHQCPEAVALHLEYACWLSAPDVLPAVVMYMKLAKEDEFWGNMILQDCKVAASAAEIDEIMKSYDAIDFSQYSKLAKVLSATQRSANETIRTIFNEHKKEMAKKIKHVEPALPLALSWRASVLAIGMGLLVSRREIPEYPRCVLDIISSYAGDLA